MKTIPMKDSRTESGLHQRYSITKLDGENCPKAEYFVLRIDGYGDDKEHVRACQAAALLFASLTNNPRLASDLRSLIAYHRGILATRELAEDLG